METCRFAKFMCVVGLTGAGAGGLCEQEVGRKVCWVE